MSIVGSCNLDVIVYPFKSSTIFLLFKTIDSLEMSLTSCTVIFPESFVILWLFKAWFNFFNVVYSVPIISFIGACRINIDTSSLSSITVISNDVYSVFPAISFTHM